MRFRHGLLAVFFLAAALFTGCAAAPVGVPSLDALAAAPLSVAVGDTTLLLETYLWRDFMPGPDIPPDGGPLRAVFRVLTGDGAPIPQGLSMGTAYVINTPGIWAARVKAQAAEGRDDALEAAASGGPKWGPGVCVDVVVGLAYEGETFLLRAPGQMIHATY